MKKIGLGLLILNTAIYLQAQEAPKIGDLLRDINLPKIEKKREVLPPLEQTKEYEKSYKDGQRVEVKKFLILGAESMSDRELESVIKPYEGQMLSFRDMQELASLITKAYKERGYFVAHAYIPTQNIKQQNGVLKIAVIEGEYGEFILENSSLVRDSTLQAYLESIKREKTISQKSLERGLLLINETPGARVTQTQIKPGEKVGSSDFIIGTQKRSRYNGYMIADNYGSQYTGRHRLMGGVDINSPFQIGDKMTLFVLGSQDIGLFNARLAYDLPLGSDGLRAKVSYSKTNYELGSAYGPLDALGYADSFVAKLSYPYIRSNQENLELYIQTSFNKMSDEIQSLSTQTQKNTLVAALGLDYTKEHTLFGNYSKSGAKSYLTVGRLSFENEADRLSDEEGANTNGNYAKININLENTTALSQKILCKNSLRLQHALANKNLDGSEDMSIGGIYGVKFYPDSEENAENGYIFSTEFLYSMPQWSSIDSQVGIFYDIGQVYMSENFTAETPRALQDAGLSLSVSYKEFFLKSHLAYKVGDAKVTVEDSYDYRFMFQGGWVF